MTITFNNVVMAIHYHVYLIESGLYPEATGVGTLVIDNCKNCSGRYMFMQVVPMQCN